MDNPFIKRATEYVPEASALLPLVSPTPIREFFLSEQGALLEKLTIVVGTPGCGKTTIARILEFDALDEISRNPKQINGELAGVLSDLKLLSDLVPVLLAYRLPMSSNFRSIWELPYSEQLRSSLLRGFVQSKAVLGWFRQLEKAEIPIEDIEVLFSEDSESAHISMGARSPIEFREHAREVELAIFRTVTSLIAPDENTLASDFINEKYDVFENIVGFRVSNKESWNGKGSVTLKPMIIVDDAHELHPSQYVSLREWLKKRNIQISRWVMCRPDVVSPEDYRDVLASDAVVESKFGTSSGRDYFLKLVQLSSNQKKEFRKIARDICKRYIPRIPEFSRRSIDDLRLLLDTKASALRKTDIDKLRKIVNKIQGEAQFSDSLVEAIKKRVPRDLPEDESLAALKILLNREKNKTPQLSLLGEDVFREEPITEDRKARTAVIDGARIQLLHDFGRPYYFGMEKLADASNSNIEQFINLSGALIDELLAQLIRGKKPQLSPLTQHKALVNRARKIISEWDFPYHAAVRNLVQFIASRCVERTMAPNAPLDDGPNAIGIPQREFNAVLDRSERLTRILHFAFAYKAIIFIPNYKCKKEEWCLLELGGVPCIAHGLTLGRGGFIEDTLSGLQSAVSE
ncbi:hypothetical protein [Spartinivicinus poritis]|uniref:Uncharacterized protein n=1 Tax=Spartinivicinus poritis TaxID=2994640 RepID=A0ABT5UEG4_9GAMM|nr:hypothetical protein [Spartinivicinus sp. A2-2]MDE1464770.1 hypothetical protein [Spartinivicinus sp. A2-2]